ncbi:hypothetical protein ABT313_28600, partial [Kribbella sp. NPDC000426]
HLQHRRADALGIISDPRYTQELLTQAHNHPTTTPTTAADTAADTSADTAADTAAAPADTSSRASTPARRSSKASSEAVPGLRLAAEDLQTGVGTRSAAAGSMSGVGARSATAAGGSFGPLDRTSDTPCTSPDPALGGTPAHSTRSPHIGGRDRSNDTPRTPSTSAGPARGDSVASPASSLYDGSCDRTSGAPRTSPDLARGGTTARPTRSPYVRPRDGSSDEPSALTGLARDGTAARSASSSCNGPRDRSDDSPCTSADPACGGTTTRPASAASPSYDGPDAGDAHPADPVTGPMAESVELREPPLEDGAGPYDPDPPSDPFDSRLPGYIPGPRSEPDEGVPMDAAAQRALDARLAQIKRDAYADPANPAGRSGGQVRPGQTEVFVHLTDLTLATGTGVLRAEGIGPLLAEQLTELVGHGPYTVKPVIDLNDAVSVDAYEIPARIRERVRLTYPVELFPYGTRESHRGIDLDHIEPYDPYGPAGQTSTGNLAPLSRFAHRVKTHARGWDVQRVDHKTLEWTTPHGFRFEVGPAGTHRLPNRMPDS